MSPRRRQRGAALLLLLVVVVLAFTAALVSGFSKWQTPTTSRRNTNAEALAQAKAALIGYIAKEALDLTEDVPGRFPCPESAGVAGTNGEGIAAANCTTTAPSQRSLGRLPWRTLGMDKLVDADGEPLWYAVAAGLPNGPTPGWVRTPGSAPAGGPPFINPAKTGSLSFDGTSNVVAVIFAPGRAISTNPTAAQIAAGCVARNQTRSDRSHVPTSATDPDFRDYLECQNATSPIDDVFGTAVTDNATNLAINDQAIVITATEVLNALQGPLAERMQRTVAPLLSEYAEKWVSPSKFLPYAVAFSPPEANLAQNAHCGSAGVQEGLLPLADNSGTCPTTWTSPAVSGDGVTSLGCTTTPPNVTCSFRYYQFTPSAPLALLGLTSAGSVTANIQATGARAALTFREPAKASDFTVTSGTATPGNPSYTPKTNGDADMSAPVTVTNSLMCQDGLLPSILCSALMPLLNNFATSLGLPAWMTSSTVSVQFPQQIAVASLSGSKLSSTAKGGVTSFSLLAPSAGDANYWFVKNEWYRYTYYAIAPDTSAAQAGGKLTVNLFPSTYGSNNDKRFVLALMGPAVTGQSRSATATVSQYIEGANAATGASPRVFAYQVFNTSGNDRIAACPFTSGASICD